MQNELFTCVVVAITPASDPPVKSELDHNQEEQTVRRAWSLDTTSGPKPFVVRCLFGVYNSKIKEALTFKQSALLPSCDSTRCTVSFTQCPVCQTQIMETVSNSCSARFHVNTPCAQWKDFQENQCLCWKQLLLHINACHRVCFPKVKSRCLSHSLL